MSRNRYQQKIRRMLAACAACTLAAGTAGMSTGAWLGMRTAQIEAYADYVAVGSNGSMVFSSQSTNTVQGQGPATVPGADAGYFTGNAGPGGPGAGMTINTASPDWRDYQETGGVAQGSMTIRNTVPAGCINSCAMETPDPIVKKADIYSYNYLKNDLGALQARYGDRLTCHSLGTTVDGRNIYEAVVGNANAPTHILVTASIHAREHITSNLVMMQLEYTLAYMDNGCFDGQPLSSWLERICLHFVPMINPDGVEICLNGEEGLMHPELKTVIQEAYANDLEMQRTTLEYGEYTRRWKGNANAVNLNDNFNALTSQIQHRTDRPSMDVYYGTPGSEPETRILQTLMDSRHFQAILNYHATGSVIYWDYLQNPLREHCRDLANNLHMLTGYPMLTTTYEGGSMKAYAGTRALPSTTLTIEVGVSPAPVNPDELDVIWAQNKFVPFYTMKWASLKGK